MYIDVHKAIRRMAPAPKARYQRRLSHGHPTPDGNDGKSSEDTKVGDEDPSDNYENQKRRYNTVSEHNEPRDRSGSPMTGTFLLRRTSAGVDGRMENVPVRASFNDIRQHLKHLGPSNPASNPKATKSTTVKIKPGTVVQDQPRSSVVADEVIPEEPRDEDNEGDETTSLLRGKVTPKDGVQALAQSYGATAASGHARSIEGVPPIKVEVPKEELAALASARPGTADLAAAASSSARPEQSSGSDTSPSGSNSPYGHKRGLFARSGSITENVVESRGIRKVVLETTSSNDDEDEEQQSGPGRSGKGASQTNLSLLQPSEPAPPEGDEDEDGTGGASTDAGASAADASGAGASAGSQNGGSNGGGGGGGKKKNRRKKRKGGKF